MGFINNKYVSKFISGGAPPAQFRQAAQETSSSLPPGWVQQWDTNSQRWYYVEQATGLTQWDPPSNASSSAAPAQDELYHDGASMMSGTTAQTTTPLFNTTRSSRANAAVAHAHKYNNLPTAAERDVIWAKERARQEREGDKKPATGLKKLLKYPGQVVNYGGLAT